MKIIIYTTLFVFVAFSLGGGLNAKSYRLSRLEADRIATRQEYFGNDLGKVYKNRFGVEYFNKIYPAAKKFESIFFSSLGTGWIYLPLYGLLLFLGFKKFS